MFSCMFDVYLFVDVTSDCDFGQQRTSAFLGLGHGYTQESAQNFLSKVARSEAYSQAYTGTGTPHDSDALVADVIGFAVAVCVSLAKSTSC